MRYVLPYCSVVVYSRCGFGYLFSCSLLFMFFLSSQPPRLQDECLEYDFLLSLPYCSGAHNHKNSRVDLHDAGKADELQPTESRDL